LTLLVAYAAPFAIVPVYFFRYRYPIEPAIIVLIAVVPSGLVPTRLAGLDRSGYSAGPHGWGGQDMA
jgi:hypothetical protein